MDAIKEYMRIVDKLEHNEITLGEYEELCKPLRNVVEVVRCRDCIHCADDYNGNQPTFTCEIGMCHESVEPSDYCSYGERGEE